MLFKNLFPSGLFSRALLIVVLPTVIAQIIALALFYERYWRVVSYESADNITGHLELVANQLPLIDNPDERRKLLDNNSNVTGIRYSIIDNSYHNNKQGNFIAHLYDYYKFENRNQDINQPYDPDINQSDINSDSVIKNQAGKIYRDRLSRMLSERVSQEHKIIYTPFNNIRMAKILISSDGNQDHTSNSSNLPQLATLPDNGFSAAENIIIMALLPEMPFDDFMLYLFFALVSGITVLLLVVGIMFLKNQIRPIRELAIAAHSFGRGLAIANFKPSGAREVRQAGNSFIVMRDRIQRQITQRTEMLAGISHDLRTPLTRMKLQLAIANDPTESEDNSKNSDDSLQQNISEYTKKAITGKKPKINIDSQMVLDLQNNIRDMEHLVAEYLAFVRGEGGEESKDTAINNMLEKIYQKYQADGHNISFKPLAKELTMPLRPNAIRRALGNLLDNACRYANNIAISVHKVDNYLVIYIDDDGPGIAEEDRQQVFKPFFRLEKSRNVKTGGVGLGMAIARDIIGSHGGTITLATAPELGGLRAGVQLPI